MVFLDRGCFFLLTITKITMHNVTHTAITTMTTPTITGVGNELEEEDESSLKADLSDDTTVNKK